MSQNQNFFDCNAIEYKAGMCAFASDYFPDHSFSRTSMIVNCPFQSLKRGVTRYLDTIGYTWRDTASNTYSFISGTTMSFYSTYAWFFDDKPKLYSWSYCNIDEDFYTFTSLLSNSQMIVALGLS